VKFTASVRKAAARACATSKWKRSDVTMAVARALHPKVISWPCNTKRRLNTTTASRTAAEIGAHTRVAVATALWAGLYHQNRTSCSGIAVRQRITYSAVSNSPSMFMQHVAQAVQKPELESAADAAEPRAALL
jgi:hypothetical protein